MTAESRAADLAPCPLCGSSYRAPEIEDLTDEMIGGHWKISCSMADHHVEALGDTQEKAIAAWNRRALTTSAAAEAAMRDALIQARGALLMAIGSSQNMTPAYNQAIERAEKSCQAALTTPASAQDGV